MQEEVTDVRVSAALTCFLFFFDKNINGRKDWGGKLQRRGARSIGLAFMDRQMQEMEAVSIREESGFSQSDRWQLPPTNHVPSVALVPVLHKK